MKKGQLLTELLKQPQHSPLPLHKQVAILYAGLNGYLDTLNNLSEVSHYESELFKFMDSEDNLPFQPYLEYLHEITEFDIDDNPIIDIVDFFTEYIYVSLTDD